MRMMAVTRTASSETKIPSVNFASAAPWLLTSWYTSDCCCARCMIMASLIVSGLVPCFLWTLYGLAYCRYTAGLIEAASARPIPFFRTTVSPPQSPASDGMCTRPLPNPARRIEALPQQRPSDEILPDNRGRSASTALSKITAKIHPKCAGRVEPVRVAC